MFFKSVLPLLLLGALRIHQIEACNGYGARITEVNNCAGPNAIILIDPNFSVRLTNQCELISDGCVTYKDFKTAMAKYKLTKDGVVVRQGQADLCTAANRAPADVKNIMKIFGVPSRCPVTSGRVCGNGNKIDVSKYKSFLNLARGNIVLETEIDHDIGKSCFRIVVNISKN